jgi:hypothetical protein
MRLLHTTKLEFEDFFDNQIPLYAILSHRWGPDEVSYQDFLAGRKKGGAGYAKILACCHYATQDYLLLDVNLDLRHISFPSHQEELLQATTVDDFYEWVQVERCDWVWIDTCCIDKSSSAELSEAINSMYSWYSRACVCYAYLSDVLKGETEKRTSRALKASEWHTRGWTLQELVAPKSLVFLDRTWTDIGTRSNHKASVALCTGIDEQLIEDSLQLLGNVSVAEKLSWAGGRTTSRREDEAYCLLGLFEINMPLLYGEGDKAFDRLQGEIIRSSNDESILLWDKRNFFRLVPGRVLADAPEQFLWEVPWEERDGRHRYSGILGMSRPPFSITNQGLEFRVPTRLSRKGHFLLPLNCCYGVNGQDRAYAILLQKRSAESLWERVFDRNANSRLEFLNDARIDRLSYSSGSIWVVPIEWVWSRESLSAEASEIVYLRLSR